MSLRHRRLDKSAGATLENRCQHPLDQRGFTLIELLIALTVLPIVIGAVSIAVITTFKDDSNLSSKLSDSHDAQFTANYFVRDVQSAQMVTTSTTPLCGSGTQVLGLEWQQQLPTSSTISFVSYVTTSRSSVVRNFCTTGASSTTSTVSHDMSNVPVTPPTPPSGSTCSPTSGDAFWCLASNNLSNSLCTAFSPSTSAPPTFCYGTISLLIHEQSGFSYWLTASPRQEVQSGGGTSVTGSTPSLLLLGSGPSVVSCSGSGSGSLSVNGVAAVDSSSPGSIAMGPNETLVASNVYSQNGSSTAVSGAYTGTTSQPYSSGPSDPDPYADLPDPSTTGLTQYSTTNPNITSLPGPGIYLKPVSITSSQTNLAQGIYIFEQGLSISGNSSVTVSSSAAGVLFYIGIPNAPFGSTQSASYSVSGNATVSLGAMAAPSPYAGVVMFQSRTDSQAMAISGNGTSTTYAGAVYAPDAQVQTAGNGTTSAAAIVGKTLMCGGNGSVTIGPIPTSTNTGVTSSQTSPVSGQSVTFTAAVSASSGGFTPAGSVSFTATPNGSSQTTLCANVPLSNGQATCTTTALVGAGSAYTIAATFNPIDAYGTSSPLSYSSSTGTLSQSVGAAATATSVTASPTPSTPNQATAYKATVSASSPGSGTPTGSVQFTDNGTAANCGVAGVVTLSGGSATCSVTYTNGGAHTITAQYLASSSYGTSSKTVTENIGPQISALAANSSGGNSPQETITGITNENSGTITVNVCGNQGLASCTASSPTWVATFTVSTFTGTYPSFGWSITTGVLTKNGNYTAQVTQVDGSTPGQPSINSPTISFKA